MKNILISGYYGFCNTGDEAMIETMSHLLTEHNQNLIVLSSNPKRTEELYHVQTYDRNRLSEIIKAMKQSDLVISGGGTLFQDITSKKSLLYYIGIVRLALLMRKKVCVAYQGMGPLNSNIGRKLTKKTLNHKRVELVALRDQQAIDFAKDIGIQSQKIIFSSDMIFMLEPLEKQKAEKLLKEKIQGYKEGEKRIGISVREWQEIDRTDLFAQLADNLVEKYHAEIVFFPFHRPKDTELSKIIIRKMTHQEKATLMEGEYLPSEVLGMMGLMDLNIGVRLHSLIFSAVMNVPTIGISYDPKIDGFLETIQMKPVCTYEGFNVDKVMQEAEKMLEEGKIDYSNKISYFKQKGKEAFEKLLQELEK